MVSNPFLPVINSLLPEPQASLLLGILFGVKTSMPNSFYQALVTTGTLHVIALSGMNISILMNLIAKMTLFLGRKWSILASLVSIWAFVFFVGLSPSVVRAAGMGSVSLIGTIFGRKSIGVLSLILVSLIMLLADIKLLGSISFQLSFLATLGILLAQQRVKRQVKGSLSGSLGYWLRENLQLTVSAQLFTLPVILFHFRRLSLISPVANLAVEWVIQPIMILGFVVSLLGSIYLPLAVIPSYVLWVPLTYFITIIKLIAKIPFASIQF